MPNKHKHKAIVRLWSENCDRLHQPYSSSANAALASHLHLRSVLAELSPEQWQKLREWGEKEGVGGVIEVLERICKENRNEH